MRFVEITQMEKNTLSHTQYDDTKVASFFGLVVDKYLLNRETSTNNMVVLINQTLKVKWSKQTLGGFYIIHFPISREI